MLIASDNRMRLVPSTQRKGYVVEYKGNVEARSSLYMVLGCGLVGAGLLAAWYGYPQVAIFILAPSVPATVLSTTGVPIALRFVIMGIALAFVSIFSNTAGLGRNSS